MSDKARMSDERDAWRRALDDARGLTVVVQEDDLTEHGRRLFDALGVRVRIDKTAPPAPAKRKRR